MENSKEEIIVEIGPKNNFLQEFVPTIENRDSNFMKICKNINKDVNNFTEHLQKHIYLCPSNATHLNFYYILFKDYWFFNVFI